MFIHCLVCLCFYAIFCLGIFSFLFFRAINDFYDERIVVYSLLETRLRCFTTFFRWSGLRWIGIFGWWYTYRIHHILIPFNIPGFFIRNKEIVLRGDPSRGGCESTGTTYAFIWCVVPKYNPRLDTMQDRCVSIRYDTMRVGCRRNAIPMPMPYGIYIERCEKDRYAIR